MINKSSNLEIKIKPKKVNNSKKFLIEIDTEKMERLSAGLGLFTHEFIKSLNRSEKNYKSGKTKKIKSLGDLK